MNVHKKSLRLCRSENQRKASANRMLSRFAVGCGRQGLGLTRQSVNIVKNNGQPASSLRAMVSRIQSTMAAEAGAVMGAQAQVMVTQISVT